MIPWFVWLAYSWLIAAVAMPLVLAGFAAAGGDCGWAVLLLLTAAWGAFGAVQLAPWRDEWADLRVNK